MKCRARRLEVRSEIPGGFSLEQNYKLAQEALSEKDSALAEKDLEIERLKALLETFSQA